MSINERIRAIRQEKGLSQEEVAEKLNISSNGYGDIERGKTDIKLSRLLKLADIFEMNLSEFLELERKSNISVIFNAHRNNSQNSVNMQLPSDEVKTLKFIIEQKDKEIALLKKIIDLIEAKSGEKIA